MEIVRGEIAALEKAVGIAPNSEVVELNDLQLALIAGGTGDVHFG
jgi:hypothetical protein